MKLLKSPILLGFAVLIFASCQIGQNKSETKAALSQTAVAEWAKDAVIYEVNIRQYTPEGSFTAFAEHLPRLQELGVDILWFMPIHPIGELNRKGTLGSYYSVKDYKGVNPEFGPFDDFKALVAKAHDLDMKVIIDWVANHSAWDNAWAAEHPDWYAKDSTGMMFGPFDWSDVAQLDYENTELRAAMKDAMQFWVREADIDGYRCDVAGMVPVDFWNDVRTSLDSIKPVFMLAEDETETDLLLNAFNSNYSWVFHHHLNKIARGEETVSDMLPYFESLNTTMPVGAWPMQFTTNHDENSWNGTVQERMADAYPTMAALTFMVEGMPLIYSGQEAGLNKRLEFFEKDTIDWSNMSMTEFYEELITLKKSNKALWNGSAGGKMEIVTTNAPKEVLMFTRTMEDNKVLAVFNLSAQAIVLTADPGMEGEYYDYFSKELISLPLNNFELEAWDYFVISTTN